MTETNENELTLERAYEILGLTNGAPREEVEKRYELLLRKSRGGRQGGFEEVNRAYKLIVKTEDEKVVGEIEAQQYGKYKRFSGHAAKIDHFMSYYKWHLIGSIAAVLLIVYGISSYMDHRAEQARLAALPPPELEASFIGRFYLPQEGDATERLEAALVASMPGWQRVEADVLPLDMGAQSTMDVAMQQKAMVQLATERPDVYIMDADSFQWIARSGGLRPLDAEAAAWGDLLPESAAMRSAVVESSPGSAEPAFGEEHVYGIDVGASPLAEALPAAKREMIVGLRVDAQRPDNALAFIERYLEAMKAGQ
ncbi:J domain-containing protein [Paenibacillus sp.]|uniref:J domain-containing protein n=1 Tax=Paenibacillus sp. TaxID=58172 RepID=UPI002D58DF81|nr:J domain-containing protein [Paenibacillus sp.]HZG58706.1 J domain-containing protein [Paenibacillus sp.]